MPLVGPFVQKVLIGGTTIGATTLTRFFTLHVVILPALIISLTALHIYLVVKMGISAPPRVWGPKR
jgi:quinol-cytochrome oxidoreductase complex cytochrome b subunit